MNVSLHLVYEGDLGRPLTAARVTDRALIVRAARTAVKESYQKANSVGRIDSFLGDVHLEETRRLEKVLKVLIPEMNDPSNDGVSHVR